MIAAGQSVGNYRILAKIGTGGMGAVYLAEHPQIGKRVALKVIHRELAGNREVVQRFFQEARAVNKIGNEHIVEIHDFGMTPEGDHYFIMEYLEGKTLAAVLTREKAIEVMRSLHIGAQIANALAAAHASGVIHRDLKPDNIMLMNRLGDPDFVKVLDFGLAKMFAAGGASAVQTAIGVLLGTPQYMSPEACESKRDIDHRTDVYALGVLLFQMMTGVLPFDGDSMGEVLVKQVTALPPAPRGLNPAIPPSVEQILLRCLAKPVDARFQTMLALRDALLDPEAYLRGSPPIAPARSVRPGEAVVDGQQMLAAADARTRMMMAEGQPPAAGDASGEAPYGMPGKSKQIAVPGLAQAVEPKMNTMRIATPHGYSSRPPRRVWPIVLVAGLLLGLGGGAFAVAWFGRKTAASGDTAGTTGSGSGSAETGSAGSGNGLHAAITGSGGSTDDGGSANGGGTASGGGTGGGSAAAAGSASASASGTGSASGSASGTGSASASGSASGSGSGSASGSGSGSASGSASASGSGSVSASGSGSGSGSGSASASGSGSASASAAGSGSASRSGSPSGTVGALAKLTLDSQPRGATVYAPNGVALGKTPLKVEWPIAVAPVTFVLKLRGYRDKAQPLTVTSNTMTRIELERIARPANPGRGSGTSGKGSNDGDGLERPD